MIYFSEWLLLTSCNLIKRKWPRGLFVYPPLPFHISPLTAYLPQWGITHLLRLRRLRAVAICWLSPVSRQYSCTRGLLSGVTWQKESGMPPSVCHFTLYWKYFAFPFSRTIKFAMLNWHAKLPSPYTLLLNYSIISTNILYLEHLLCLMIPSTYPYCDLWQQWRRLKWYYSLLKSHWQVLPTFASILSIMLSHFHKLY